MVSAVRPLFQRKSGGGGPGGWWILTEVELLLSGDEIVRPDVLGWLGASCPERPTGTPVRVRPDWVCEVVSPSNANDDTVKKLRLYHRNEIPHYWVVDPRDATLTVLRFSHALATLVTSRYLGPNVTKPSTPSPSRISAFS